MFIIAGQYRRQKLQAPSGKQTRPTANRLRQALFNICQSTIENSLFLDVFAGSGAMGLEALSRGAQSATFIEAHREAIHCIEKNVLHLKVQKEAHLLRGEAFAMLDQLEKLKKNFDIIFVDPPYGTFVPNSTELYSTKMIQWVDTHDLLRSGGLLFVEEDFRFEPEVHFFKTLSFKNSRRFGHSALHQYQRD